MSSDSDDSRSDSDDGKALGEENEMDIDNNTKEDDIPSVPIPTALDYKDEGNQYYKSKEYTKAVASYTKAIELDSSDGSFYTNRAAARMMLLEYKEAINDCNLAITSDSTNAKAYFRKASAEKGMGRIESAIKTLQSGLEIDPTNTTAKSELSKMENYPSLMVEAQEAITQGFFRRALNIVDTLISNMGTNVFKINLFKMEVLMKLQRPEDALNLSNSMMRSGYGNDSSLLQARATCLYSMGDLENAVKHLQQAMRSDPDNQSCRTLLKKYKEMDNVKSAGATAYKEKNYEEAINQWTHCLSLDPSNKSINAKLHCNRANALCLLKDPKLQEALKDCDKAIYLDNNYQKAYLRRADCYLSLGEKENITKAIEDYEKVAELYDNEVPQAIKDKIKKAKIALKRAGRKDFYRILGVGPNADEGEIKKAYKKMALKFHPDRHSNKSDADKAVAEAKFKDIGEAYEILTDPEKKRRYDNGVDPEDLDNPHAGGGGGHHHHGGGGGGMGGIDPNILFQMFMQQQGGGGGGGGMPGMGGGRGRGGGNPFGGMGGF